MSMIPDAQRLRSRWTYIALFALTVASGLASRRFGDLLPRFVTLYVGDALWAAMVFWIFGVLAPVARTRALFAATVTLASAVEISQLYHTPLLDAARHTRLGALALGQGFLWSDLACYVVGAAAAAIVDRYIVSHAMSSRV
jgi:Protein of unknown function (DUF2809)